MKARLIAVSSFLVFMFALVPLVANTQSPEGVPPENVIRAEPVHGVTIGPGKKLWVFVFPAKGGEKGPPEKPPKEEPTCPDSCSDDHQDLYSLLGFQMPGGGLQFNINENSIPNEITYIYDAIGAIDASFNAWTGADPDKSFTVIDTGGANRPAEDGNNTVGWGQIVPRNTLAATWIWTTDGIVTDVDIFFNLFHKWGVLSGCNALGVFDVQNVGTHEVGHVVGLAHVQDDCKMATMYPSAPKGETKKRTLTTGDTAGANAVAP